MADFECRKLFVGGIPRDAPENVLNDYFSRYGEVLSLTIAKDRMSETPRGFGFVTFTDPSSADKALSDRHEILGRRMEVKKAIPKDQRSTHGDNQFRTKKIFVGGLSANLTEEELKDYFEKFGRITDAVVMHDNVTNRPRGFGFVTFESEDMVEEILKDRFYELGGKQVEVKRAIPKDQRRNLSNGQISRTFSYNPEIFQYGVFPHGYNSIYSAGNIAGFGMPVVVTVNPWNVGFQMARYLPLPYNSSPIYHMNGDFGSVTIGARNCIGNVENGNLPSGVRLSNLQINKS